MATNSLIFWVAILFMEWFFLAREGGDENRRNYGLENLGWFLILLTSLIGIGVLGGSTTTSDIMGFLFGVVGMTIALIKLFSNWYG